MQKENHNSFAGEPILIIDDTPVNLKLTRVLLAGEGYDVRTAGSAEEALEILKTYRPRVILADIQLPGMDGLELTRRLRADEATRDIVIIALTAYAMQSDQQKALEAGCDAYVTKPIDTRSLPATVKSFIARKQSAVEPLALTGKEADEELAGLKRQFLVEGTHQSRQLLENLPAGGDTTEMARWMHRWAGSAGSLGYPEITRCARRVESILQEDGRQDVETLRQVLGELASCFSQAENAEQELPAVAPAVTQTLSGKRFGIIGFSEGDAARMADLLERSESFSRVLLAEDVSPGAEILRAFDILIVRVHSESEYAMWLRQTEAEQAALPVMVVGPRKILFNLAPDSQSVIHDFLAEPWDAEETVVRSAHLLTKAAARAPSPQPEANGRTLPSVLIADDDPTVTALVRATLQNYGMSCSVAADGSQALNILQTLHPDAAVIDVNMPKLDGFELLAALKNDPLTSGIRIILLTARQQESDVIRGFGLGADDYVIKPFSPMELVIRLKRILRRRSA